MKSFCKILCISTLSLFIGMCGFFLLYNEKELEYETATLSDNFIYQSHPVLINDNICELYPNSNNSSIDTTNYYSNPIDYTNGHMIIDVVLFAFEESPNYFNDLNMDLINAGLQYTKGYYNEYSFGKLKIDYNIYSYKSNIKQSSILNSYFDFDKEYYMHSCGVNYGDKICGVSGTPNGKILILGINDYNVNTNNVTPWPHAWSGNNAKLITLSSTLINSLTHEMGHLLNLKDLYSNTWSIGYSPDLMGEGSYLTPTSAHNRYCLGWLTKSYANDNIKSNIEILEDEGTYIINSPDKDDVIAYQIGVGKEYFLIEIRNQLHGINNNYLVVQKININYSTNLNATGPSNSFIYFLKSNNDFISECAEETDAFLDLKYSNNISSGYSIINLLKLENGAYQFDFVKQKDGVLNGKIFAKNNLNNILSNAKILINNKTLSYNGIADSNLNYGDVVDIVCDGYQSKKIEIKPNIFNFKTRNLELVLNSLQEGTEDLTIINCNTNSTHTTYKFEIFVLINQLPTKLNNTYEVLFNNSKYNIEKSFSISLTNGDYFEIKSSKTIPLCVSYYNDNLYVSGGQIETKYGISKLILNLQEQAYYFNVYDATNNTSLNNINIEIYNNQSGIWESVVTYQLYDNNTLIYAINNINSKYSKAKITYNSFGTAVDKIIELNATKNYYNVEITKNLFQSVGDFFTKGFSFIKSLWK